MKINKNFLDLEESYLFSTVNKKTREFAASHPDADIIKLSIGDVTRPLCPAVIDAMHKAVDEMADEKTFRGYPPEQGYDFILEKILEHDYIKRGINLTKDEIFLSDGAKSDCGNIGDIFATDNTVAICDPVYPVYIDTNIMNGRKDKIIILPCSAETEFLPAIPGENDKVPDIIYLCFPNNPTGTVASKAYLKKWVDYANKHHSVILYDSAYEAFITDPEIPKSIYEIEGAESCAIELRSFSKTAGFTGLRCGYTVVPHKLVFDNVELNSLWRRRQSTKFNGVSYITQRAAEAVYSSEGQKQIQENLSFYRENAELIFKGVTEAGFKAFGGKYSPYVWLKIPEGFTSWSFFDELLVKCNVVGTPGSGFGKMGEGYLRLTGFGSRERTIEAIERIKKIFAK
ncbi:LL-diaminopimelate aminotransferase [Treponema sp.]|uniref:LL-diaminopimelate aminotransferase n=1 Tax=Treponema sp. TaxID=166 RepID=UPI00298E8CA5|nr:LL-diaminopimelate aminotransferase [Treponema sp.]